MDLSSKQLKAIKKLSYNLTHPIEIARIIEIDEQEFITKIFDESSDIFKYFNAGYLKRKHETNSKFSDKVFADILALELKQVTNYQSHLIILKHAQNI